VERRGGERARPQATLGSCCKDRSSAMAMALIARGREPGERLGWGQDPARSSGLTHVATVGRQNRSPDAARAKVSV